jgi:lipase chaperone LimK
VNKPRRPLKWGVLVAASAACAVLALTGRGAFKRDEPVAWQPSASPGWHDAQTSEAPSLFGTVPDGQFVTVGGELVLSPELIKRFEYHLSTIGERSIDQIRAAIVKDLKASLNERGLKEAMRLLDQYWQFKTALVSLQGGQTGDGSAAMLAYNFQAVRNLRAQYFQPREIKALFAQTDEYDSYMVQKMGILQNKSLTPAEQQAQLAKLTASLSPQARADVEQPVIHLTLADKVAQAREQGASAQEIRAIRTEMVGAAAATRLEALDREEADWQDRIAQYKAARAADPVRAEALKSQLFSKQEQLRLAAYE